MINVYCKVHVQTALNFLIILLIVMESMIVPMEVMKRIVVSIISIRKTAVMSL